MVIKERVLKELKKVIDPELDVDIVSLGLIYDVEIDEKKSSINIKMTLTSPGCPLSMVFDTWVRDAVLKIKGVKKVTIDLVWEPVWTPDRMTDEARDKVGLL